MDIFKKTAERPTEKIKIRKPSKKSIKPIKKNHKKSIKITKLKKIKVPRKIKIKNVPKKLKKIEIKNIPKKNKVKVVHREIPKKMPKMKEGKPQHTIEHIKTYIPGFDQLFEHGIPKGNAVLVEGGPGSGKTIFCLQLAYNACKNGKKVLYMSFEEPEENLMQHMRNFGWDAEKFIKQDMLRIKRFNALDVARSVEALLSEAKKELLIEIQPVFFPPDFKPEIVCIDSLTSISSAFSGEENRFRIYMEQLFRYLEKTKISSFLIREVANPTHVGGSSYVEKGEAISFLSDGIIIIYNVIYGNGTRGSAIEVLKMRGEKIAKKIVQMDITKHGLVVSNKGISDQHHIKYSLC